MLRRRSEWWARNRVLVASVLAAAALALVTAVLALVVEDLLPAPGTPRRWSGWRFLALAGAFLVLVLALRWRGREYHRSGTLFYARVLDEGMPDYHEKVREAAGRRRIAARTVTDWVDVGQRTATGVVDAVGISVTSAATLALLMNTDRTDTGNILAPNMLWPVALSVGYRLPAGSELRLLELGAGDPADTSAAAEIEWPVPPELAEAGTAVRTLTRFPGVVTSPTDGANRLGLMLAFAPAAQRMHPEVFFAEYGVREYVVLQPADVSEDRHELKPGCFTGDRLAAFAAALPGEVAKVKRNAGGQELVVAAAMPKTLAVALGMGLSRIPIRVFAGTHLLHWDDATNSFVPFRVHPSQPETAPR